MRLERFLFAPVNPVHVGICRIVFAGTLALVFWRGGSSGAIAGSAAYWMVTAVAWTMFCCGVAPRAAGLLLAALLFPHAFQPGLSLSRQTLLLSLVAFSMLHSNARLSLWRRGPGPSSAGPAWPIRFMQLQLSVVYGVNAIAKSTPQYLSGDTLMALSLLPNFRVDMSDRYLHLGGLDLPASVAAMIVVLAEYTLAVGIWFPRLRLVMAVFGVAFHIALTRVVQIGMLHVACLFLYVTFLVPFFEDQGLETESTAS